MKSKRIQWLDFAKGFLIFTVLVYHSILTSGSINIISPNNNNNLITRALKLFMMPCFFAISGYLYKSTNTVHKYCLMFYKKFISIMIPGVIFTLIGLASQNYRMLPKVLHKWYYLFLCQYGDTWFLTTLFFIFVVVGLLDLLHLSIYFDIIFSIALFIIGLCFPGLSKYPYIIQNVIGGSPLKSVGINILFFYLGYIFKNINVAKYAHKLVFIIFTSISWLIVIFIEMKYQQIYKILGWPQMITSLFSVTFMFMIFINFHHNNFLFKFFDKYGKYTLIIYLVHWPIVYYSLPKLMLRFNLVNLFINSELFLIVTKIIVAWILSIAICHLAERITVIDFIFYPRKYLNKLIIKTRKGKQFLKI